MVVLRIVHKCVWIICWSCNEEDRWNFLNLKWLEIEGM